MVLEIHADRQTVYFCTDLEPWKPSSQVTGKGTTGREKWLELLQESEMCFSHRSLQWTFIVPLLATCRVYDSIYKTRDTNSNRQAPLSYLGVPLLSLKMPLDEKGEPPDVFPCLSLPPVGVAAMSTSPHRKGTLCPMLDNHVDLGSNIGPLLAARSIYRTRITSTRQAPLSSLGVPFFKLKMLLNPPTYAFCFLFPTAVDVAAMSTSPHNNGNPSPKLNDHMILALNFRRSTCSSMPSLRVHLQDKINKQQASAPQLLRGALFILKALLEPKDPTPPPVNESPVISASAFYFPMRDSGSSARSNPP